MAEELRLWPDVAVRLAWLGWIAMMRRAYPQAREYCERALRLAVEQGHQMAGVLAEIGLGLTARRQGELEVAETHLRTLLKAVPQDADTVPPLYLPLIQVGLGYVAEQRGTRPRHWPYTATPWPSRSGSTGPGTWPSPWKASPAR